MKRTERQRNNTLVLLWWFILIPEEVLIERQLVGREDKKKGNLCIPRTIHDTHWLYPYVYSYENPNKEKIMKNFI